MNFDRTTQQYFHFLEALGQAVIATDVTGAITSWSRAAEALYGWTRDEVIGRNVLEVTPMELSRARGAEVMQALARGELWSGEFQVRTRRGKAFTASVTDVPLLGETGEVAGVIGVSAPSRAPTKLKPLLKRFEAACGKIWPKKISFDVAVPAGAGLAGTEPHLIQLLALLMLLYTDALEGKIGVEVTAGPAEQSPLASFGLGLGSSAIYIGFDRRDVPPAYSVLRTVPFSAEPTKYASALVQMVGGMLIAGTAPGRVTALHLLLPLKPTP